MQDTPEIQKSEDDSTDDTEEIPTRKEGQEFEGLFVEEKERAFWDTIDVRSAFDPLSDEEKALLEERLPARVAQFLIRRADGAVKLRESLNDKNSFFGKILKDMPPDRDERTDWENEIDEEFKDYVYESAAGPPTFRRRGSSLFGGGDGLPDVEDTSNAQGVIDVGEGEPPKKLVSLFVGEVGGLNEQASRLGYSIIALLIAWLVIKIIVAAISFFVSFTFSFVAIFALSAGIFMVFFFLRF